MDSVISIKSLKGEVVNVTFTKYRLLADKPLPDEETFWVREKAGEWKFLVENDAELIALKKELDERFIKYEAEENIELSPRDKRWIVGSRITSRSAAQRVLDTAAKIDEAPDLQGIKDAIADTGARI